MSGVSMRSKYGSVKVTGTDITVANGLIIKVLEDAVFDSISEDGITDPLAFHGISGSQPAGEEIYAKTRFTSIKLISGTISLTHISRIPTSLTPTYSTEYQTVYDSFATKPSDVIASAQNTMVKTLIDASIWAKLDLFYLFAQTTDGAGESLKNWVNPGTYDCTLINTPTFVSLEGWTGSGAANGCLDTHYNPTAHATNYAQNSASMGIYIRTNVDEARNDFGNFQSPGSYLRARTTNTAQLRLNSGSTSSVANTDSKGMFVVVRSDAANQILYKNKVANSNAAASNGIPNCNIFVCSANNGAGVPSNTNTKQVSCFFMGGALSPAEVTIITDAIEVYMDSNSKGVIP